MHCLRSIIPALVTQQKSKIVKWIPILPVFNPRVSPYKFYSNAVKDDSEIINEIAKSNPDLEQKLRILMLEVEVMRQDGRLAPDKMKLRNWEHLLKLESRNQRANYLKYLFKTEKSKENQMAKKMERRKEFEEKGKPEVIKEYPDDVSYGMSHNSLFLRIRDQSINNFDNYRALQAMIHGQSLVIDCSYEQHMITREILNAAKQVTYVFGHNRLHKEPFNIHLCNVNNDGEFMTQFRRNVPTIDKPWFPINIHAESYMNIFPRNKLVYLTPHCRNELVEFDDEAIYIVGCIVDKVNNEPLSLAKAKKDGIKMAKLPLDRYIEWAPGSNKSLNINHMVPILLDLKLSNNWEYALRHVPRRKLMETKIRQMQEEFSIKGFKRELVTRYQNLPNVRKMSKRINAKKSLYKDDESM